MTQFNMRIGTPGYMSPEQIEGGEIDGRSDLFAVGVVCYELLSYREAFTGANTRQVETKVLQAQPTPLASLVPGIDPELVEIVNRALEKDPDKRYQDAATFANALDEYRRTVVPEERTTPAAEAGRLQRPDHGPGDRSHASRAESVYQRAVSVDRDGAHDAARRFAIEALVEDPRHAGARALLARLDPGPWTVEPTVSSPVQASRPFTPAGPSFVEPTFADPGSDSSRASDQRTVVRPSDRARRTTAAPASPGIYGRVIASRRSRRGSRWSPSRSWPQRWCSLVSAVARRARS